MAPKSKMVPVSFCHRNRKFIEQCCLVFDVAGCLSSPEFVDKKGRLRHPCISNR